MSAIKELRMLLAETDLTLKVYEDGGRVTVFPPRGGKKPDGQGIISGSPGSMAKVVRGIEAVVSEKKKPGDSKT